QKLAFSSFRFQETRRLLFDPSLLPEEVRENSNLRAHDLRQERLEEAVDATCSITPHHEAFVGIRACAKEDGDLCHALALSNDGGKLEAVHLTHRHGEEDDAEVVVLEQQTQSLLSGRGADEVAVRPLQNVAHQTPLVRLVMHDEHVNAPTRGG